MDTTYEDFSMWFEPALEGGGFRVTARCRAGEGSSPLHLPKGIENLPWWPPCLAENGPDSLAD